MFIRMWAMVVSSIILVSDVSLSLGNLETTVQPCTDKMKSTLCEGVGGDCKSALALFAAVLNPILSDPVLVTEIPLVTQEPELTTTLLENTTGSGDSLLMNLPFAQSLKNPCSWDDDVEKKPSREILDSVRVRFVNQFYRFISHYASLYKENVKAMLESHTIVNCVTLEVTSLPHTPTLNDVDAVSVEDAMDKIYLSLLVHSAYSYFVHHQFNTELRCADNIEDERFIANQTLNMALKQKALACYMRLGMIILGYNEGNILPLLSVRTTDLSICSRRAIRDCQVMKSMYNFLDVLSTYFGRGPPVFTTEPTSSDYTTTAMGER